MLKDSSKLNLDPSDPSITPKRASLRVHCDKSEVQTKEKLCDVQ